MTSRAKTWSRKTVKVGSEVKRLIAGVDGDVQEVGFRAFALSNGRNLRLRGYVENLDDGSVRIVAEGPRSALEEFLRRIEAGDFPGSVTSLKTEYSKARGRLPHFKVKVKDVGAELFQGFATAGKLLHRVNGEMRGMRRDMNRNFGRLDQSYGQIGQVAVAMLGEIREQRKSLDRIEKNTRRSPR